jgi:hypothetical protein
MAGGSSWALSVSGWSQTGDAGLAKLPACARKVIHYHADAKA